MRLFFRKFATCRIILMFSSILTPIFSSVQVDFISRTMNLQPIAHVDHFSPEKLGQAAEVLA